MKLQISFATFANVSWCFGGFEADCLPTLLPLALRTCRSAHACSLDWCDALWQAQASLGATCPCQCPTQQAHPPLCPSPSAHITGQKHLSHCRRRDARDAAAHWPSDDASSKSSWFWAVETKGLFSWGHRWGVRLRLIVIMAQHERPHFSLSRFLTI